MVAFKLSPDVLEWAAEQSGETLASLAIAVSSKKRTRELILEGVLTAGQAVKVAAKTGVPFGFLFLAKPPTLRELQLPDLRQLPEANPLGRDFRDTLADVVRRQQWYSEHIVELGAQPLQFVGRFKDSRVQPLTVAEDMRRELGLHPRDRAKCPTAEAYFSFIADRAESIGILVMKSGVVGSNTKRPLAVREFRGLAIADPLAPVVFINGRDVEVASVFTLVHELAHIWYGQSGVSDLASPRLRGVEQQCDRAAAELLVPRDEFLAEWTRDPDIDSASKHFRVSRLVIARRARDLGRIDQDAYDAIARQSAKAKPRASGGSAYRTIPIRSSKRLTRAVVGSAMAGRTMLREAATLLNVRPDTVVALAKRLAADE